MFGGNHLKSLGACQADIGGAEQSPLAPWTACLS